MAKSGVFFRGGVDIGKHYETPRMIVSPALIKAYEIESKVAKFPRIVFSEQSVERINAAVSNLPEHKFLIGKRIIQDADGVSFLNPLIDAMSYDFSHSGIMAADSYKESVEEWIKDGLAADPTPSMKAKYEWLVNYHNNAVRMMYNYYIDSPGDVEPPADELIKKADLGI